PFPRCRRLSAPPTIEWLLPDCSDWSGRPIDAASPSEARNPRGRVPPTAPCATNDPCSCAPLLHWPEDETARASGHPASGPASSTAGRRGRRDPRSVAVAPCLSKFAELPPCAPTRATLQLRPASPPTLPHLSARIAVATIPGLLPTTA